MTRELCRDLVGRNARLVRDVVTRGGVKFATGEVLRIAHTWRGRFTLDDPTTARPGMTPSRSISKVHREAFEVLPSSASVDRPAEAPTGHALGSTRKS